MSTTDTTAEDRAPDAADPSAEDAADAKATASGKQEDAEDQAETPAPDVESDKSKARDDAPEEDTADENDEPDEEEDTPARYQQPANRPGFFTRLWDKLENKVARLSSRNNFWHRVCSYIWLPFAFRSGIRIQQISTDSFWAVLPFTRFNRNWYHAMAGAALLGNSEIAGGMFVFGKTGAEYTVVCKELHYKFLRPCVGPACYKVETREDIDQLIEEGGEFNTTLDIDVVQVVTKKDERERRVGKVEATFHVTPKDLVRQRRDRRQRSARKRRRRKQKQKQDG